MKPEERIPGVTFHLESAKQLPSVEYKAHGLVTLKADIDDFDVWDEVVGKLNGLRIYEASDLNTEMIEMLQEDNNRLEGEVEQLKEAAREREERHAAYMDDQLRIVAVLGFQARKDQAELEHLRELKLQLDALSGA